MDFQLKIKAQSEFEFEGWSDRRGMRMPVAGTVARGALDDAALARFKDAAGNYIANPIEPSLDALRRGRERYDIFCSVCHDRAGSGNGMVMQRTKGSGAFNPNVPNLATDERVRGLKDGELFERITTGGGTTMPAYGSQIPPTDRWKIVHYLRALQNRVKS